MSDTIKTRPQSKEYDEGYDRTFGADRKPVRGRWIWDEATNTLVPADQYNRAPQAIHAPIMVDRYMEGVRATDGTDIGSRRKRRDWMRVHGYADASDYGPDYGDRVRASRERAEDKQLRDDVGRAAYQVIDKGGR